MSAGLFPKLAWTGIRKNRKLYLPYLLTCIGMAAMLYIISYLAFTDVLDGIRGSWALQGMLGMGTWVIALFTCLLLNYSNSFLMRRRKKEFGLYNILGMDKGHLGIILLWENLITFALSVSIGLIAGMAFSKAAELCLLNMLGGSVDYALTIAPGGIIMVAGTFAAVFAFIMLRSLWQIRRSTAIALLHSENTGEKLPRFSWLWGIAGCIILAAAYYLAVSIEDPLSAIFMFFVAVLMVIIATYLLFSSGSVFLCRLLRKNTGYYYKANHFVSVSSMTFRMLRNGTGLASICILLTMVLVMLSSTSCLFFGVEDALRNRYPRNISIEAYVRSDADVEHADFQLFRDNAAKAASAHGAVPCNIIDCRIAQTSGQLFGSTLETDPEKIVVDSTNIYGDLHIVSFVPLEDYNRLAGTDAALEAGEILVYALGKPYEQDTLTISGSGATFQIKEHLDTFPLEEYSDLSFVPVLYAVVPDFARTLKPIRDMKNSAGNSILDVYWNYGFDVDAGEDVQMDIYQELYSYAYDPDKSTVPVPECVIRYYCQAEGRSDFMGNFAGLFVLGIMLSIVFIFAAVLIIYYKQITEGYEDQSRFEIMQKVGMTKRDIRRSINSQMLTVFFLPLVTAGVHLAFAFPMIRKLLLLFNMQNVNLFIRTTLISFGIFAVLYVLVYRITSTAYYDIVSGAKNRE